MKKILISALSLILCTGMLFACTSCGRPIVVGDLTEGMLAGKVDGKPTDEALATAYTVLAQKLLASLAEEGKNTLVSPLSVIIALSLAGNGAKGQTRDEIEALLGSGVISLDDMNEYLYSYVQGLYDENNRYNTAKSKIKLANSVWFREGFPVKETYLQKVTDYYLANAYELPFDNAALKKIKNENAQGEYYLTDVPAILLSEGGKVSVCSMDLGDELIGVNTVEQLRQVEDILRNNR